MRLLPVPFAGARLAALAWQNAFTGVFRNPG